VVFFGEAGCKWVEASQRGSVRHLVALDSLARDSATTGGLLCLRPAPWHVGVFGRRNGERWYWRREEPSVVTRA
jgi:hypothetical protein